MAVRARRLEAEGGAKAFRGFRRGLFGDADGAVITVRVAAATALAVARNCSAIFLPGAWGRVKVAVRPGLRASEKFCGTDTKMRILCTSATSNNGCAVPRCDVLPPSAVT